VPVLQKPFNHTKLQELVERVGAGEYEKDDG
jgi:hypothetical protein